MLKVTRAIYITALAVLVLCGAGARAEVKCSDTVSLPDVVRKTMQFHFAPANSRGRSVDQFIKTMPVAAQYNKPAGVFVTLSREGKARACWGSVFPQEKNLVAATAYATLGALTRDYRYRRIRADEWQSLKPQVTVVEQVEPIENIRGQNPLLFGLFVRSGARTAVLLPGEAKDPYYQLVKCKLKAGIRNRESCQLYRIRAHIYE